MSRNGEFLKSIRKLEILIEKKKEFLEKLEHEAVYHSPNYEGERIDCSNAVVDGMAEKACKLVDLKDEINRSIDRLIDIKLEAMRAIDELENADEIQILYSRYLEYRPWDEIIAIMGKSSDWCYKLHKRAIKKLKINFKNM